jgi:hypothetical protein
MPDRTLGLLLTLTEPVPRDEDEFNAWYDTEHLPERLAIPGFVSARRWADPDARPGEGRYLATYELERPEVLETPEYLAHVGDGFTPWSKRVLGRCAVFRRWACTQITPGDASPAAEAIALFAAIGDVPPEHETEFNRWYDEEHLPALARVPGVLRARRFRASSGTPRYVALYDLADPDAPKSAAWRAANETPWSQRLDALTAGCEWLLRRYLAYRPAGAA